MGGIKGFNIVFPDRISENKIVPNVLITDLKIFNKSVKPGQGSALSKSITELKSLRLSHAHSVITLSFAAMDFSAPENNQYAYMLENFDSDWIYSGNRAEVTYTNLDPGSYIFHVKGSNNDGLWNDTGTSIKIIVVPPWWLTWWSKLTFGLLLAILLTTIYLFRVKDLKKQKTLLEKTVAIKTAELKDLNASKDKFFSIIAHDLKNPFTTIIGFSDMLNEEIDKDQPSKIREFARLINVSAVQTLKLLENLLEWAKSQNGKIPFNPEQLKVNELIEEEFLVLKEMANEKNIELKYLNKSQIIVLADRNMIKTVLRNLISNAIKFTHRNGQVEVKASVNSDMVGISVIDNGIGMSEVTKAELFKIDASVSTPGTENEKGTGLGLFLCKEFVEKHGGKIWAESQQGKGSIFIFMLPSYATDAE
jgi:signal transduction histidine kinase